MNINSFLWSVLTLMNISRLGITNLKSMLNNAKIPLYKCHLGLFADCSLCIRRYIGYKSQCPACAKVFVSAESMDNSLISSHTDQSLFVQQE